MPAPHALPPQREAAAPQTFSAFKTSVICLRMAIASNITAALTISVQRMVWVLKTRTRSYFVNDGSCVNTDFYMVYRGLAGPITPLQKHTSHRRYL